MGVKFRLSREILIQSYFSDKEFNISTAQFFVVVSSEGASNKIHVASVI